MKDRFGREHVYLRVSVTDRCNLRCTYCAPAGASPRASSGQLSFDELERLVAVLGQLGIRKVRITGGEPTLRPGLVDLCRRLSVVPGIETLALTTNGVTLAPLAKPLFDAGIRHLNVSLDSTRRHRFATITGRDALPDVLAGIDAALAAGFQRVKLNTVVMAGVNDDELLDFVELGRERPLEIRFIELMPFRNNGWRAEHFVASTTMMEVIGRAHRLVPLGSGARTGGVAKDFSIPGHLGRVAFVTPFSESFCDRCNRLRLTASGQVRTCLFSDPSSSCSPDLGAAMRAGATDAELTGLITAALADKPRCHPSVEELLESPTVTMCAVGG